MARSPYRAAAAIAFMIVVGWFLQSWLRTGYFTVIALLLVWGQVAGFFLPTRYELTDEAVSVRGLVSRREKRWSEFRSYHVDREGILLSPCVGVSRLARFRGTSLQFEAKAALESAVKYTKTEFIEVARSSRERSAGKSQTDSTRLIRETRDR